MTSTSPDLDGLLISIGKIEEKRMGNPKTTRKESDVAVMLARLLHVSKSAKERRERPSKRHIKVSFMHMEVRALFGQNVRRDYITNNCLR